MRKKWMWTQMIESCMSTTIYYMWTDRKDSAYCFDNHSINHFLVRWVDASEWTTIMPLVCYKI